MILVVGNDVTHFVTKKITISTARTLNDLKHGISRSKLGPLDPKYQRLFYLGREVKSGGRSLSKIGIGKFDNYTLHLHSTQPKALELSSDEEETEPIEVRQPRRPGAVINLLESDDEDEVAVLVNPPPRKRRRA